MGGHYYSIVSHEVNIYGCVESTQLVIKTPIMTPTIKTQEVIVRVPGTAMTNLDILYYVEKIQLPNFVGVYMRDTLPSNSWDRNTPQFGIMNLNKANQIGVHWVAWGCIPNNGIYFFDSFGADLPIELLKYLKTKEELAKNEGLIQQNT